MDDPTSEALPTLSTHKKRPQWGPAILAWSRKDKRAYQFRDGKLRRLKKGYYHLMEPIDLPVDELLELDEELRSKLTVSKARKAARAKGQRLVTLNEQIAVFRRIYPGGFGDPAYVAAHRGDIEGARPLKRQWDKSIKQAQSVLAQDRLGELIANGAYDTVIQTLDDVLAQLAFASSKTHRSHLWRHAPAETKAIAKSLHGLLWGDGKIAKRVDAFASALATPSATPSWQLVTAPAALVHPTRHVAITPTAFRSQARWMAPNAKLKMDPSGKLYKRMRSMTERIKERLESAGFAPRDLVDVHVFIWETLRQKRKAILAEVRPGHVT